MSFMSWVDYALIVAFFLVLAFLVLLCSRYANREESIVENIRKPE
ncbi:MAG TPA: hypothetical protein VGN34_28775 [Ktedonobacteraceae bacterium]